MKTNENIVKDIQLLETYEMIDCSLETQIRVKHFPFTNFIRGDNVTMDSLVLFGLMKENNFDLSKTLVLVDSGGGERFVAWYFLRILQEAGKVNILTYE